jgi:endonuclease V-like protein UPF0215 family
MKTFRPTYNDTKVPVLPVETRRPSKEAILAALQDEKKFHDLFSSFHTLLFAIEDFKQDEALCRQIMAFMTSHPAEFDHVFKTSENIAFLKERKSEALGEEAIQFVLSHEEECNRILRSLGDLDSLHTAFPNHASIFGKPTVALAKAAAREEREYKK